MRIVMDIAMTTGFGNEESGVPRSRETQPDPLTIQQYDLFHAFITN
jgi:hypothetical protein